MDHYWHIVAVFRYEFLRRETGKALDAAHDHLGQLIGIWK